MREALLEVEHLSKRFVGIVATDDLSLSVDEGELHAVIGPNGAGKTTLIAQLSGQALPDSGYIRFLDMDITRLPSYRRSHLGLARSFQITSLFHDLSVLDNVALAVQAHAGHSFRFWKNARGIADLREPAREALRRVGLERRAETRASLLSHGEHRLLELAMALAGKPRMLLLDEPMAGLGPEESARRSRPTRASAARAGSRKAASLRASRQNENECPACACTASATLSCTLRSRKRDVIWNERASPSALRW